MEKKEITKKELKEEIIEMYMQLTPEHKILFMNKVFELLAEQEKEELS